MSENLLLGVLAEAGRKDWVSMELHRGPKSANVNIIYREHLESAVQLEMRLRELAPEFEVSVKQRKDGIWVLKFRTQQVIPFGDTPLTEGKSREY